MKPELEDKLCKEFPTFFRRERPITESLMAFGFECGNGWFDILHSLCTDIKNILEKNHTDGFEVVQIKEKYGGLRFYVTGAYEEIWKRIDRVEEESFKICDVCGKPGKLRGCGWLYTSCEEHERKSK